MARVSVTRTEGFWIEIGLLAASVACIFGMSSGNVDLRAAVIIWLCTLFNLPSIWKYVEYKKYARARKERFEMSKIILQNSKGDPREKAKAEAFICACAEEEYRPAVLFMKEAFENAKQNMMLSELPHKKRMEALQNICMWGEFKYRPAQEFLQTIYFNARKRAENNAIRQEDRTAALGVIADLAEAGFQPAAVFLKNCK